MCIDPKWMPLERLDPNGHHEGISSDFFNYFQEIFPISFETIITESWSDSLKFAKERRCDILSMAIETPSRKEYLNFTSPHTTTPLVVATKLNIPFIDGLEELNGKKVAIPRDYGYIELIKDKYPSIEIVEADDILDGLDMVNDGKAYGYIGTLHTIGHAIQKHYSNTLKIAGKTDEELQLGIGVRSDDKTLLEILQKAVNNITEDKRREVLNKWVSIKYEEAIDYELIVKIVLFFLLILAIGSFFLHKLRVLNKEILKQQEFVTSILNTQPNLTLITSAFTPHFANRQFLDFFDCSDIDDFATKHGCLSYVFIQEESYFHRKKIPEGKKWIDTLLALPSNERIVSIEDKNDDKPKAFHISIATLKQDEYIITLNDISETIQKQHDLIEQTTRDKLTGAYNRVYFEQQHKTLIKEYTKEGTYLAIAVLDIDHFKKVNDTYGHDVGDTVLQTFARSVQKHSRSDDKLIRWGGEEFLLLLRVTSEDGAKKALEHIRTMIEKERFFIAGTITCSIGVTIYQDSEDIKDSFKRADKALYRAKGGGRNRVLCE